MSAEMDLSTELRRTKVQLAELTEQVEQNTRILKQSQQRELRLLHAEDIAALFVEMTEGLLASYQLQAASVVIADPDFDIRHLLLAAGHRPADFARVRFVESLTGVAPQYIGMPKPWLGTYTACDHQLILPAQSMLASVAMIPLNHRRRLIGSLNFGSNDAKRFTRDHATDFFDHLGVIASFALENVINRARLLRSGFTDVLTGWNNRRFLQARMLEELARARRDARPLTGLMIDVDHFKQINDSRGHAAGDDVLRELTQRIETEIRATDVAARYGGEEFVVLLPGTDRARGTAIAERIREAVAATAFEMDNGEPCTVTVSIGLATTSPGQATSDLKTMGDSLLAHADVALYEAKTAGRNKVCMASNSM